MRTPILAVADSGCYLALALALADSGCYTADLAEAGDAAFRCRIVANADPDADCGGDLRCDGSSCLEEVPVVEIRSPEGTSPAGQILDNPSSLEVVVSATGLNLSNDADDPNAGFLRVTLDGNFTDLTSGPISGSVVIDIEAAGLTRPTEPGGHRLSARAFRPDGTPFRNTEALVTRLFWVDDGQPHVAITSPWPGTEFGLDAPLVDFEVATLNFELDFADTPVNDAGDAIGHAHLYYDDQFPGCEQTTECDIGYIAVISRRVEEGPGNLAGAPAPLPDSAETTATLTAVLRRNNHSAFDVDYNLDADLANADVEGVDCDVEDPPPVCFDGDDGDLQLILDEIEISRVSN